jgi:hypothetical protein
VSNSLVTALVNCVVLAARQLLPVYPDKQTSSESAAHSVGGITVRQTDSQQNTPPGRSRAGSLRRACASWAELRRTQYEQISFGLPLKANITQYSLHVSKVPAADSCAAPLSSRHYPSLLVFLDLRAQGKRPPCGGLSENLIGCFSQMVRYVLSRGKLQPVSFRPDVGCSHDLGPCLGFFDNELREVGRRAYKRLAA